MRASRAGNKERVVLAHASLAQRGLELAMGEVCPALGTTLLLVLWPCGSPSPSPPHPLTPAIDYFYIFTDDDDLGFEFANKDSELTEDEKIALLGKPKLGNATRTQIRIKENKEYRVSDASSGLNPHYH